MPTTTEQLRQHWGAEIKRRRNDQRMTRSELAHAVGVWPETIYRIEKGVGGSDATRAAIAAALGFDVQELYTQPVGEAS